MTHGVGLNPTGATKIMAAVMVKIKSIAAAKITAVVVDLGWDESIKVHIVNQSGSY